MPRKKDPLEGAEEKGTTLEDFIIPQKLHAFTEAYAPVDKERLASDIFDDAKLRTFFKAYPCSLGDPLVLYLGALEMKGYKMRVAASGEPALFVVEKATQSIIDEI